MFQLEKILGLFSHLMGNDIIVVNNRMTTAITTKPQLEAEIIGSIPLGPAYSRMTNVTGSLFWNTHLTQDYTVRLKISQSPTRHPTFSGAGDPQVLANRLQALLSSQPAIEWLQVNEPAYAIREMGQITNFSHDNGLSTHNFCQFDIIFRFDDILETGDAQSMRWASGSISVDVSL